VEIDDVTAKSRNIMKWLGPLKKQMLLDNLTSWPDEK